jgi:GT2 family glycosyltransferase
MLLARGNFIQFLDAGDIIATGKFERQLACFTRNENADVVFSDFMVMYDGKFHEKITYGRKDDELFRYLLHGNVLHLNAMLFRKRCLASEKGFNEDLLQCEDWDLWIRLSAKGYHFAYSPGYEAWYIKVPFSLTRNIDLWITEVERMIEIRNKDTLFRLKAGQEKSFFFSALYFLAAWRFLYNRRYGYFLKYCRKSLIQNPLGFLVSSVKLVNKTLNLRVFPQNGDIMERACAQFGKENQQGF